MIIKLIFLSSVGSRGRIIVLDESQKGKVLSWDGCHRPKRCFSSVLRSLWNMDVVLHRSWDKGFRGDLTSSERNRLSYSHSPQGLLRLQTYVP